MRALSLHAISTLAPHLYATTLRRCSRAFWLTPYRLLAQAFATQRPPSPTHMPAQTPKNTKPRRGNLQASQPEHASLLEHAFPAAASPRGRTPLVPSEPAR